MGMGLSWAGVEKVDAAKIKVHATKIVLQERMDRLQEERESNAEKQRAQSSEKKRPKEKKVGGFRS
jgi:hypothetical protein